MGAAAAHAGVGRSVVEEEIPVRELRLTVLSALMLTAQPALAECSLDQCDAVRITGVYTYGAYSPGHAWIATSGTETLLSTCTPESGSLLRVDGSEPKSDWLFAQILAAYQTQETLLVRVTGGGGVCRVAYIFAQK